MNRLGAQRALAGGEGRLHRVVQPRIFQFLHRPQRRRRDLRAGRFADDQIDQHVRILDADFLDQIDRRQAHRLGRAADDAGQEHFRGGFGELRIALRRRVRPPDAHHAIDPARLVPFLEHRQRFDAHQLRRIPACGETRNGGGVLGRAQPEIGIERPQDDRLGQTHAAQHLRQLALRRFDLRIVDGACRLGHDRRLRVLQERRDLRALQSPHRQQHAHAHRGRIVLRRLDQRAAVADARQRHHARVADVGILVVIGREHLQHRADRFGAGHLAQPDAREVADPRAGVGGETNHRGQRIEERGVT